MATAHAARRTPKLRVAVLEDHQITIDGYLFRLKDHPQIEVVGTAAFGEDLESLLAEQPVDVAILDVSVPTAPDNRNPYPILHAIPRLLETYPNLAVLIVSMLTERPLIQALLEAGASGYVLKDDSAAASQLPAIVQSVAKGGIYLSAQVAEGLLKRRAGRNALDLSPQQSKALSLCAAYPNETLAQLAQRLAVKSSTMRNLLSQSYLKLDVRSRGAAVARARQLGLITPD
jgi:DNA-binding NarL/FixJ family response regulator